MDRGGLVTPVRGKRGLLIHLVASGIREDLEPSEAPIILCGTRIRSLIVEPDAQVTCEKCIEIATTN
jgi:hypothetical protein